MSDLPLDAEPLAVVVPAAGESGHEALREQLVAALRLLAGTCQATADILAMGKRPPTGWPDMVARRYDMVRNRGTAWTQATHPAVRR